MVISWKVIKKEKQKNRLVPETQKGQHNRTKLLLPLHLQRQRVCSEQKKHTIVCNASYLYNYIEISRNSLISFFLPLLTTVITVKRKKKRTAMLESIRSIIPSWKLFKMWGFFLFFFLSFFFIEGTPQQTKCAATHQRGRKSFKKSI